MRPSPRHCLALLILGLVLSACTDIDDVQRAVSETDSEVAAHETIIDRATSLAAAHDELDRHAAAVDADMRRIRSRLDDVDETCNTDRGGVWAKVFDLDARIKVYLAEAGADTTLSALRAASKAYRTDMTAQLATLQRSLDDLPCW